jgi:hypothetical protein
MDKIMRMADRTGFIDIVIMIIVVLSLMMIRLCSYEVGYSVLVGTLLEYCI